MSFQPTSRYYSIETTTLETPDGKTVRYLRRRFLPLVERFTVIQQYVVTEGDRLDNITARFLGDPEQFWRICDANPIKEPEELEPVGHVIRLTMPEGMPGAPNA
jgi:hypothetical protein